MTWDFAFVIELLLCRFFDASNKRNFGRKLNKYIKKWPKLQMHTLSSSGEVQHSSCENENVFKVYWLRERRGCHKSAVSIRWKEWGRERERERKRETEGEKEKRSEKEEESMKESTQQMDRQKGREEQQRRLHHSFPASLHPVTAVTRRGAADGTGGTRHNKAADKVTWSDWHPDGGGEMVLYWYWNTRVNLKHTAAF